VSSDDLTLPLCLAAHDDCEHGTNTAGGELAPVLHTDRTDQTAVTCGDLEGLTFEDTRSSRIWRNRGSLYW